MTAEIASLEWGGEPCLQDGRWARVVAVLCDPSIVQSSQGLAAKALLGTDGWGRVAAGEGGGEVNQRSSSEKNRDISGA